MNNKRLIEAARLARIALARRRLLDFTQYTFPEYKAGWFHSHVCERLEQFFQDVQDKKSPRLMLFAPPRHGKSELVSRRFPAWAFGRNPDINIIGTSYGASLASDMNRDIQGIMLDNPYRELFPEVQLPNKGVIARTDRPQKRDTSQFSIIDRSGYYRCAGVGGGITGKGANIFIIDDPIKDAAEADSEVVREGIWRWYLSTAYTRLEAGGGMLLMLTRWHADDPAGRLLKEMEDETGDKWDVVSYPAIAKGDEKYRKQGDALHPERYSLDRLEQIKRAVGSRVWNSLYQQAPTEYEGGFFQRSWFEIVDAAPQTGKVCRYWDRAATEQDGKNDPDWTAGPKMRRDKHGIFYIEDVERFRGSPYQVETRIVNTASQDGHSCKIGLEQEPGASGKSEANYYTRVLSGYTVKVDSPQASKTVRASPFAAQCEAGNVKLVRGPWNKIYLDELCEFPTGKHDDQVDGSSGAFHQLDESRYSMYTGM